MQAAGDKHLEEHWRKGYGGLRKEGEDYQDEQERLQDLDKQVRLVDQDFLCVTEQRWAHPPGRGLWVCDGALLYSEAERNESFQRSGQGQEGSTNLFDHPWLLVSHSLAIVMWSWCGGTTAFDDGSSTC